MPEEESTGFTFVDKRHAASEAPSASETPATTNDSDDSVHPPTAPLTDATDHLNDTTVSNASSDDALNELDSAASADLSEEDDLADAMRALPHLGMRERLLMCIDLLNQGAWISLGLLSDPATGKIEPNFDQAKTAIDSVAFLVGKVEGDLDEATRRDLRTLVRDLQVNYVQQSSRK